MGDVEVDQEHIYLAEQRTTRPEMDQGTETQGKAETGGNRSQKVVDGRGGLNTFEGLPNELHLEVLRRLDFSGIKAMRGVNQRFHALVQDNQESIIRASLENVECCWPHSALLQYWLPEDGYTFKYAGYVCRIKWIISRVAEICRLTQYAKIDALYCIFHSCNEIMKLYESMELVKVEEIMESYIREVRRILFSQFSTPQIQQMIPTSIRLVFKAAELVEEHRQGSPLHINIYNRFNRYLIPYGPGFILELHQRGTVQQRKEFIKFLDSIMIMRFPRMHDELIKYLETRGHGLMTEPGIEIQQFLQEEDTSLDMRHDFEEPEDEGLLE